MTPVGFEPTISKAGRPQNYALDSAATGTGKYNTYTGQISKLPKHATVLTRINRSQFQS
jgi:hypothetical protein